MSAIDSFATELNNNNKNLAKKARSYAFDLIAIGLIVVVGLLNLGAIKLRDLTFGELLNIILETIPFYMGSVALALNYYKKGVYSAKASDVFLDTVKNYSKKVNGLSGKQIDVISDFCFEYNDKALRMAQTSVLHSVAITYERFAKYTVDDEGHKCKPLKMLSHDDLIKIYGEHVADKIEEAKNVKIKGLNANLLLSSLDSSDITDLGPNEEEMFKQRRNQYAGIIAISVIAMSLMAVKNILEWGWMSMFLIAFKMIYILCRSYMKYFEGYDDINVRLVNHISRKVDIIKQFEYWYEVKYTETVDTKAETVGNI